MKKLLGYLPFHFLLCLIVGISIQYTTNFWDYGKTELSIVLIVTAIFLVVVKRTKVFVILTWITFFLLGVSTVFFSDATNSNSSYQKHLSSDNNTILIIRKVLKPGRFHDKYEAEVVQIWNKKTSGNILLNIGIDTVKNQLKVDDQIYIAPQFLEVNRPLNPHQFDYKNYLERQGIHHQVFLKSNQFLKVKESISFLGFIARIRSKIQKSLYQQGFSNNTYAVINALLLGQRQDISKELIDDYARAGAIHILAVSGLHVGIVLLLLSFILKPLERLKKGRIIKLILIVVFLWFFALLAGMSASVVRAVTMFSAVAIGQTTGNKNSIEHSLIFSMFILLLCKPMFLFDVGFQLSYLAVFGIVQIQPKLSHLWKPKFMMIHKLWQLFTVSIAAQLAVLPLSVFYFHQFPALFWLSNLAIVPFLGIILIGGVLMIMLSLFSLLPDFFVQFYDEIISLMNGFIRFVSKQEAFLFSDISFSRLMMIGSYCVIVFGVHLFYKINVKRLLLFLCSIATIQVVLVFEMSERTFKKELIVFHKSRNSVYGIREGRLLRVYHTLDSLQIRDEKAIISYKVGEAVQLEYLQEQPNYIQFLEQQIVVIDSLGVYNVNGLKSPIILLKDSPKLNLERLIDELNPKQIIADGSNYKSSIELWKQTCLKRKTPFWITGQNGAYILKERSL